MAWEEITGYFTMWLHPEFTVGLWAKAGVPFGRTFLYVTCWTSITLILTYFGIDVLRLLGKVIIKLIRLFKKDFDGFKKNNLLKKNEKYRKKIMGWLIRQKKWVILGCSSIPLIPFLPAAVIIATKTIGIKYGLLILLAGNVIRNWCISFGIYHGFIRVQDLIRFFS